jgi:hypothetical protein
MVLVRCQLVIRWEEIPINNILRFHNVLYDSADAAGRQPIDLATLPTRENGTNKEINVYDADGRRVPRFMAVTDRDATPCGLLVNLETIPDLFSSFVQENGGDMQEDDTDDARINVYPQAFLRKFGHVQANSILPHFRTFVSQVQRNVTRAPAVEQDSDEEENGAPLPTDRGADGLPIPPVVIPSACQFYSELSHRVRPSAALHEVQQGRITCALAGAYATSPKDKRKHKIILRECENALPHQKYNDKIKIDDVPRALRLENIYILQLDSLKPEKRNGQYVSSFIIILIITPVIHDDSLISSLAVSST